MSKEVISYDDFKKLDIRVGEITGVEVVLDADKLLKLTVDLGEENPRTIVSGIREHVENPEELVGIKTLFVCNLEPRVIRGIESQGMLFAIACPERSRGGGDAGFSFVIPKQNVVPGSPLV